MPPQIWYKTSIKPVPFQSKAPLSHQQHTQLPNTNTSRSEAITQAWLMNNVGNNPFNSSSAPHFPPVPAQTRSQAELLPWALMWRHGIPHSQDGLGRKGPIWGHLCDRAHHLTRESKPKIQSPLPEPKKNLTPTPQNSDNIVSNVSFPNKKRSQRNWQ